MGLFEFRCSPAASSDRITPDHGVLKEFHAKAQRKTQTNLASFFAPFA
jgi:hypothetical protein